jgi:hypothetical protein
MVQPAHGVFSGKEQTMKPRLYGIGFLVAILAALALGGPARAGEQVPFNGQESGVLTQTAFSFPFVTFSVVGEGEATHVGRFALDGQVAINVITGDATGAFTLTAANGDMLFLTLVGRPPIDPTHSGGDFTIVGGTGRFQGASGSFTDQIEFAFPLGTSPNPFIEVFAGTISSPGSNQ